ncbi:hypothetical protein GOP47_0009914 [Adiantum capillus-veneris]|uniref:Uncharacterized protein n=1 Tax=Adiantum capillus-veneris TaxID=13818 RepID=A0A9D4UXH8_ADICA|nr:hypothetical protein GOP47_0009914 [Adiantum capillus-veneris]
MMAPPPFSAAPIPSILVALDTSLHVLSYCSTRCPSTPPQYGSLPFGGSPLLTLSPPPATSNLTLSDAPSVVPPSLLSLALAWSTAPPPLGSSKLLCALPCRADPPPSNFLV